MDELALRERPWNAAVTGRIGDDGPHRFYGRQLAALAHERAGLVAWNMRWPGVERIGSGAAPSRCIVLAMQRLSSVRK